MEKQLSFDLLPGMVFGLQQQITELKTIIQDFAHTQANTKQPLPDAVRIYGDKELAKYLGCTVQTVSRQKQAGRLPFHRIGRKYFYLRSEIDLALKGKEAI